MEDILNIVGNFGFPIAVSIYLLVRIEGKLNELTSSITELAKAIAILEVKGEGK
ncbi:MAG: YvrJ family protein [Desulfitobacterium sp.]